MNNYETKQGNRENRLLISLTLLIIGMVMGMVLMSAVRAFDKAIPQTVETRTANIVNGDRGNRF